jgi:hypothetical protein
VEEDVMAKNDGPRNDSGSRDGDTRARRETTRSSTPASGSDVYFEPRIQVEYPKPEVDDEFTFHPRAVRAE